MYFFADCTGTEFCSWCDQVKSRGGAIADEVPSSNLKPSLLRDEPVMFGQLASLTADQFLHWLGASKQSIK